MLALHAFASPSASFTPASSPSRISSRPTHMYAFPTLLYVTVPSFTSFKWCAVITARLMSVSKAFFCASS